MLHLSPIAQAINCIHLTVQLGICLSLTLSSSPETTPGSFTRRLLLPLPILGRSTKADNRRLHHYLCIFFIDKAHNFKS